jgi:hypothetical protein
MGGIWRIAGRPDEAYPVSRALCASAVCILAYEVMVEIPSATRAVYVQLTFIDGTASGIDYFAFFTFSDTALAPFFSASVKAASNDGPD